MESKLFQVLSVRSWRFIDLCYTFPKIQFVFGLFAQKLYKSKNPVRRLYTNDPGFQLQFTSRNWNDSNNIPEVYYNSKIDRTISKANKNLSSSSFSYYIIVCILLGIWFDIYIYLRVSFIRKILRKIERCCSMNSKWLYRCDCE